METIASQSIIPAVESYCASLGDEIVKIRKAGRTIKYLKDKFNTLCENLEMAVGALEALTDIHRSASEISDIPTKAESYKSNVVPKMDNLRKYCDILETLVPKERWPLPNYTDLMYRV